MQSSILSKVLSLLTIISEANRPPTFSELVALSGLNKSTTHRLLSICTEENLVQFDKQRKAYLLGTKLFELTRNAYKGYDIQVIALGEMIRLHKLVQENVTLGIQSGQEVVYLRILEADFTLGTMQQPGMREPIHCSASGKALLAFAPPQLVEERLSTYQFDRFTANTITTLDEFNEALKEVRKMGYARNDREEYDHLVGISAPIFNYMREPIAVLNIWTLHHRHSIDKLSRWSDELIASANRVTELIGGLAPEVNAPLVK